MAAIHVRGKTPCELLAEVHDLSAKVQRIGQTILAEREQYLQREAYRTNAHNLVHYLALRRHDLRDLQLELSHLGFASLERIEADVLGTLTAIERALRSLCDGTPFETPPPETAFKGLNCLRQEANSVLGLSPEQRSVRIMVTLPKQAAKDPAFVATLIDRGADCVRINCAHGDADIWAAMIDNVKRAAAERGTECRIYMDIAGPKIRTEAISFKKKHLVQVGDTLLLTRGKPKTTKKYLYQVSCSAPEVFEQVAVGESVWFDDGKIGARVVDIVSKGLVLYIEKTGAEGLPVRLHKGINFPETTLNISPLTDKDRQDLDFIVQHADMVGYSFVQTGDDIALLQSEMEKRLDNPADLQRIALIAKIETRQAVSNLPSLILRGAGRQPFGVMVARGDLAVEIGFERLAEMQEEILWVCEAARVPVIWATQVLESVTKRGMPSRGEMTDAAAGIHAECVMLNKGDYIADAVTTLDDVLRRMTSHQVKKFNILRELHSWERYVQG